MAIMSMAPERVDLFLANAKSEMAPKSEVAIVGEEVRAGARFQR